jgi:hypothetical protein
MGLSDSASVVVKRHGRPHGAKVSRQEFADSLREAARYAIRKSLQAEKFSLDATVEHFVIGVLGHPTDTGHPPA